MLDRRASSVNFVRNLVQAVTRGKIDETRKLLCEQKVDPNLTHRGIPVLNYFCQVGCRPASASDEILALLLENGANIEGRDEHDNNVFHVLHQNPHLLELVLKAARERNAPLSQMISAHGFLGDTPLHNACRIPDNAPTVALLVAAGADVNAKNNGGIVPIMNACWALDVDAVRTLIAAKADVNAVYTKSGRAITALSIVGSDELEQEDAAKEIRQLLVAAGATADGANVGNNGNNNAPTTTATKDSKSAAVARMMRAAKAVQQDHDENGDVSSSGPAPSSKQQQSSSTTETLQHAAKLNHKKAKKETGSNASAASAAAATAGKKKPELM